MNKRYDEIEEIEKFNPFHDARGRFANARGFKTYSANPKTRAGAMAITRSDTAGHGRTLNVHSESKGESIRQNAHWLATGQKPKVPAATSRARYQQRKLKQQQAAGAGTANASSNGKPAQSSSSKPANAPQGNRIPVDGKDISTSFSYSRRKIGSALDQAAEQQGFKGKPVTIRDSKEFSAKVQDSGMIAYRTINSGTDVVTGKHKTGAQFADDLKNSDTFSHNGGGGQVYGGGIYMASTSKPVKGTAPTRKMSTNAKRESQLYGGAGAKTVAMTLDKNAKVGDYKAVHASFLRLPTSEQRKYNNEVAAYATSKGYDALRADIGGLDYVMVYNRTKLIIFDP